MPQRSTAEEQHVDRLIAHLTREYDGVTYEGVTGGPQVDAIVRAEFERLWRESAVTDFVPILAERRARARLSDEWGGRRASGAAPEQLVDLQGA